MFQTNSWLAFHFKTRLKLTHSLKIHRASAHNIDVGIKKRKCGKCSYETFKIGRLYQHIRSVHDKIRSHICEECDYATSSMANLKRHKRSVHRMMAPKINPAWFILISLWASLCMNGHLATLSAGRMFDVWLAPPSIPASERVSCFPRSC